MRGNGVARVSHESPDLLQVLNAARNGKLNVRIAERQSGITREVAAGLNEVFAELEELRRERNNLLRTLEAFEQGNFAARVPLRHSRSPVARALNNVIGMNERVAGELERVSRLVGKEGKLLERASLKNARGSWGTSIAAVNTLIGDLVQPNDAPRNRRPACQGRLPPNGEHHQYDGWPTEGLCL